MPEKGPRPSKSVSNRVGAGPKVVPEAILDERFNTVSGKTEILIKWESHDEADWNVKDDILMQIGMDKFIALKKNASA